MNMTLDLFDLSGRRALITGGAGLLGREFAVALIEAGAEIFLMDHDEDALANARDALAVRTGKDVHTILCDIADEDAAGTAIDHVADGGTIEILINGAAVNPRFESDNGSRVRNAGAFATYSLDNWRRSMDVNLTGVFIVTRAVCAVMEKTGKGTIVNIASHYGLIGPDQRIYREPDGSQNFFKPADYSTTKAGVLGFTRAVASYYRGTEIRVNALSPGGVFNGHDDHFVENYSSRTILGRMARPDEFRGAIVFLCSDASSYMTGANLVVDGGWTAL